MAMHVKRQSTRVARWLPILLEGKCNAQEHLRLRREQPRCA